MAKGCFESTSAVPATGCQGVLQLAAQRGGLSDGFALARVGLGKLGKELAGGLGQVPQLRIVAPHAGIARSAGGLLAGTGIFKSQRACGAPAAVWRAAVVVGARGVPGQFRERQRGNRGRPSARA